MRLVMALIVCLGAFKSFDLHAQGEKSSGAQVVFDPLFWKDELKLTNGQYNEIRAINKDYYEAIYRVVHENAGNVTVLRSATADLLQKRSDKIWNTFQEKQRKKWKKLASSFSADQNVSYSAILQDLARFPG